MKITFLGAAKTVTGSCFLIETENCSFLVDCGMFQGHSKEEEMNKEKFPFDPQKLDFVLLTHAHIDHSGRIPKLYTEGFKGNIYATKATVELCEIMLPDSGHIQEFEVKWINERRQRRGQEPVPPLYTLQDAVDSLKLFKPVSYGEVIKPHKNIRVRFNDAGHLLGSAIIEIWVNENDSEIKIVFTGDLGNKGLPLLRDPSLIESADYLIMESTYGDREHRDINNKIDKFLDILNDTIIRGGNVIIPSFAVGRTQEIIYEFNKYYEKKDYNSCWFLNIPVFIDSPLATSATEVFRNNLDCFDEEAKEYIRNGDNPLDFPQLHFVRSPEESKALNEREESAIIISASGMCEAGRIKFHLKNNLWRKDSSVIFVGYQAEGTLGRKILDGAKRVRILGEEISVNARIEMIEGFSGHADKNGLLDWIGKIYRKLKKIFLVHGEEEVINKFSDSVEQQYGIETIIPENDDSFILTPAKVYSVGKEPAAGRKGDKHYEYKYTRLEILDILDGLKEDLADVANIVRNDLKEETSEYAIQVLKAKLKSIQSDIRELLN